MEFGIDKNGDGVIDNVIVCDSLEKAQALFPNDVVVELTNGIGKGVTKVDGVYVPRAPKEAPFKRLTQIEFVRLCLSVGGMTQTMLGQAKADSNLAGLWVILELSQFIERNAPEMAGGLDALVALGYLPNGKQAVLDGWPKV